MTLGTVVKREVDRSRWEEQVTMDTVVRREGNSSRWVGEMTLGSVIRREVNSSRLAGEVTLDTVVRRQEKSIRWVGWPVVTLDTGQKAGEQQCGHYVSEHQQVDGAGDSGHCGPKAEGHCCQYGRCQTEPSQHRLTARQH